MIYRIKEVNLFKKNFKNSKTGKEFHILKAVVNGNYYTVDADKDSDIKLEFSSLPITLVNVRAHVSCKEQDGYKNYNMYIMSYESTKAYVEEEADIETAFQNKSRKVSEAEADESTLPF